MLNQELKQKISWLLTSMSCLRSLSKLTIRINIYCNCIKSKSEINTRTDWTWHTTRAVRTAGGGCRTWWQRSRHRCRWNTVCCGRYSSSSGTVGNLRAYIWSKKHSDTSPTWGYSHYRTCDDIIATTSLQLLLCFMNYHNKLIKVR